MAEGLTGEGGGWAHPIPDAAPWQTSPAAAAAAAEETPLAQVREASEPPKKIGRTNKIQPQMPTALPNHGRAAQ